MGREDGACRFRKPVSFCDLRRVPPFNSFELDALFDQVAAELGLPRACSEVEAVNLLVSAQISRYFKGEIDLERTLRHLGSLAHASPEENHLDEFYLLDWAYQDILAVDVQFYVPGANSTNIVSICEKRFEVWQASTAVPDWGVFEWETG